MDLNLRKRVYELRDKLPTEFRGEFMALCYDFAVVVLSRSEDTELSRMATDLLEKVENAT